MKDLVYCVVMHFWEDDDAVRYFYFRDDIEREKFLSIDVFQSQYIYSDIEAIYLVKVEDKDSIHFYYE